jgi:hypothetical protein
VKTEEQDAAFAAADVATEAHAAAQAAAAEAAAAVAALKKAAAEEEKECEEEELQPLADAATAVRSEQLRAVSKCSVRVRPAQNRSARD